VVPWVSTVNAWSSEASEVLAISSVAGAVCTLRRESICDDAAASASAGGGEHGDFAAVASAAAPLLRAKAVDSFAPKLVGAAMVRCHGDNVLVTSDTTGACHLQDDITLKATGRFTAHVASVTALASLGAGDDHQQGGLATASTDGRVKLWKLSAEEHRGASTATASTAAHTVQQVGEFACRSGVTSLAVVGGTVFCGDALGFVYLLDAACAGQGQPVMR
jgi:hypothetical protein